MITLLTSLYFIACSSEIDNKPSASVQDVQEQPVVEEPKVEAQPEVKEEVKADAPAFATQLTLQGGSSLEFVGAKITGDHKGGFSALTGSVGVTEAGAIGSVELMIDLASTFSDAEKLTGHLMSPDFFDVGQFPKAVFTSSAVTADNITGTLDFHGVKKEVSFPASFTNTDGVQGITAEFTINRKDWGLVYPGKPDDLIKDEVLIKAKLNFAQ
jgi:polyisoprenoid-binding protein YceI